MKSLVFAAVVMMASACWGQQPEYKGPERIPAGLKCTAWNGNYCLEVSPIAQPAPLKCGNGQHAELGKCTPDRPASGAFVVGLPIKPANCDKQYEYAAVTTDEHGYKESCFPLPHTVTEKEWQEMMAKIKKLEAQK